MCNRSRGSLHKLAVTVFLAAVPIVVPSAATARDTPLDIPAHQAAETREAGEFLLGVPFWMKGEPHEHEGEILKLVNVTRAASGVLRSDRAACTAAFLDALKVLQQHAIDAGANALVDVVSTTRGTESESAESFRCVAGATVVHVGLRATLVRLPEP